MNETTAPHHRAEVHLEELGQHTWWKALVHTPTGTNGSARYRCVARSAGRADTSDRQMLSGSKIDDRRA